MAVNVLIVDDLTFIKIVLRDIIEKAGFRVVGEASNGEQAITLYQDTRPDVVLMDITMPGMDGLTALRKIREIDAAARVIICSALGQQQLIVQAIQLGARDFIVKPFQPQSRHSGSQEGPRYHLMKIAAVLGFACLLALRAAFSQDVLPPAAAPGSAPAAAAPAGGVPAAPGTPAAAVPSPATNKPDLSLPKDVSTQWQVGITVFSAEGLSPDNAYLAYSLPLLLKNQVSGLAVHTFLAGGKGSCGEGTDCQGNRGCLKKQSRTRGKNATRSSSTRSRWTRLPGPRWRRG